MLFIKNEKIKTTILILIISINNFSCSQLNGISNYDYEINNDNSCDSCINLKISNDVYKIENYKNIYKNDVFIYKCESDYLIDYQVYNNKMLVITHHDEKDAKSAVGFELRPIIKMTIISLSNPKDIKTYNCFKSFSSVHIKKIKDNGDVYIKRKIKPKIELLN